MRNVLCALAAGSVMLFTGTAAVAATKVTRVAPAKVTAPKVTTVRTAPSTSVAVSSMMVMTTSSTVGTMSTRRTPVPIPPTAPVVTDPRLPPSGS